MTEPALARWIVEVPAVRAEEAIAALLVAFPDGIEEVTRGATTAFAGYRPADAGRPDLPDWLPASAQEVPAGWRDAWRAFHRPVQIGDVWVRPPWIEEPRDAVVLEPGNAFGTGAHGTTRGAGALLLREPPGALLDLGCGSGLLSLLAARAGHMPILAMDIDPAALAATRANAVANGVGAAIEVREGNAVEEPLPAADLAVMNIERRIVEFLLRRDDLPGTVIASGLRVEDPLDHAGWAIDDEIVIDGWRSLRLRALSSPA